MSGKATSPLVESSDARFEQDVLGSGGPVLVEFFATWCEGCRRFAPTLEGLAREYAGRVPVVQVNADENPELVRRYGVSSTPTLVLFSGGEPAATLVGAQPAAVLRELLDPVVGRDGTGRAVSAPTWAPVDACTLPTIEQPLREAEFAELFATALRGVQPREPGLLRLHLDAGAEGAVRDLVARESACCTFFDFRFAREDAQLVLEVRVPPERVPVLDGIARLARAARERTEAEAMA